MRSEADTSHPDAGSPPRPPRAAGESPAPEASPRHLRALVRARYRVLAASAGGGAAALLLAFLLPPAYTARVVLLPTEEPDRGFPGQLTNLAASFGLQAELGAVSPSDLYPQMLTSERLLLALAKTPLPLPGGAGEKPLLERLVPGEEDEAVRAAKALKRLRRRVVRVFRDAETGIVSLEVTLGDPRTASGAANRLTTLLEEYLIEMRQKRGERNRTFIDGRLAVVAQDLQAAEENLKRFREANRRIADSPELQLEEERLRREVLIQEQVFLELKKQKEIAEIEEVKNTPILQVLDRATPPTLPSRPNKPLFLLGGVLLGGVLACLLALSRASLEHNPDLREALLPVGADASRLLQVFRRRTRTAAPP